jgi:exopolyphosphatase / guanosine-5'-triphosphate,3'-diphosphate pyrophosphatase
LDCKNKLSNRKNQLIFAKKSFFMKKAIIDLGTNTFHLLIIEQNGLSVEQIYKDHVAAKIGKAGINQGFIAPEAIERAVGVLRLFRQKIDEFQIDLTNVTAIGTSAIRNASNGLDFCQIVENQTGIIIQVISGEREAELIYEGVKLAMNLGAEPSLIMDIGGGSVEFIIGNADKIYWKQSFEIGGQRLIEKFMTADPISSQAVRRLNTYFQEQLLPLHNAIHQYAPKTLVGSSGSFDTLVDIDLMSRVGEWPDPKQTDFTLSVTDFTIIYELLIAKNRTERMAIAGMIDLRVDMIVVGVILIDYILKSFDIQHIRCSTYALKEGIMQTITSPQ